MAGSCYKVSEKFEPCAEHKPQEAYLCAEIGDMLVDCERVDDHWFRGTNMVKQISGRIPMSCIVPFTAAEDMRGENASIVLTSVVSLLERENEALACQAASKIAGAITENPMAVVLDKCPTERRSISSCTPLDKSSDKSRSASDLDSEMACLRAQSKEENYVDMSSGESLSDVVGDSEVSSDAFKANQARIGDRTAGSPRTAVSSSRALIPPVPSNPPKPSRGQAKFSSFRSKASDEGYSGSLGENTEQSASLLVAEKSAGSFSKNDEVGYEVPMLKLVDSHGYTLDRVEAGPKGRVRGFFRKSSKYGLSEDKLSVAASKTSTSSNGAEECGYYAPNAKLRDSYFLPSENSSSLMIRMLVCFSASVLLSLAFCLVLLLVADWHPVLCFSLATIVFVVIWVAPVTLLNRGLVCVLALMAPSLFSAKMKVGIFVLLLFVVLTGPVFGVIDKLSLAISCQAHLGSGKVSDQVPALHGSEVHIAAPLRFGQPTVSEQFTEATTASPPDADALDEGSTSQICYSSFDRVLYFCSKVHQRFTNICRAQNASYTSKEQSLCLMPVEYFCGKKERVIDMCTVKIDLSSQPSSDPENRKRSAIDTQVMGDGPITREKFLPDIDRVVVKAHAKAVTTTMRTVILCLLPLLVLLLVHEAYSYNKDFQTTKDADNVYITSQLKGIDSQRKLRGLTDLIFPLTRLEFRTNLVRRSLYLSKHEKIRLFWWMLAWLMAVFLCIIAVILDEYVGRAVRVTNFTLCPVNSRDLESSRFVTGLYSLLAVLFVLILLQSHVLRLRSKICSMFYTKRESVRAMHLYYRILHDRAVFNRRCRRRVQLLAEEKRMSQEVSFKTRLYRCLPSVLSAACDALSFHSCMICGSWSFSRTVMCADNFCRASFCYECFVDAGQRCVGCSATNMPGSVVTTGTV